jgi:arylformamidase
VPKIFDISVPVTSGGTVYPGNPEIRIEPASEVSKGASSNTSRISLGSHTGTHVDAMQHFFDGTSTVDQLPLESLMGPATVIAFPDSVMSITADHVKKHKLKGVKRLLIKTRNSSFIKDGTFHPDYTYVAPDGAEHLVKLGVKLVGVDYLSVEQFHSGHHKTHRTLLGKNIVIVEGLDFSAVKPGKYDFYCLPLRLAGLDGAPARAVLIKK